MNVTNLVRREPGHVFLDLPPDITAGEVLWALRHARLHVETVGIGHWRIARTGPRVTPAEARERDGRPPVALGLAALDWERPWGGR